MNAESDDEDDETVKLLNQPRGRGIAHRAALGGTRGWCARLWHRGVYHGSAGSARSRRRCSRV